MYEGNPKEKLDGIVHFARIIDKAQAKGAGGIGEYIYPCPLDEMFLVFFEIASDDFFEAVQNKADKEIVAWLREHGVQKDDEEIAKWNDHFLNRKPENTEEEAHFLKQRNRLAPNRVDIVNWVDLLDLHEGRDLV